MKSSMNEYRRSRLSIPPNSSGKWNMIALVNVEKMREKIIGDVETPIGVVTSKKMHCHTSIVMGWMTLINIPVSLKEAKFRTTVRNPFHISAFQISLQENRPLIISLAEVKLHENLIKASLNVRTTLDLRQNWKSGSVGEGWKLRQAGSFSLQLIKTRFFGLTRVVSCF